MRKTPEPRKPLAAGEVLGGRVRQERRRQGLTLEALADRIGELVPARERLDASTIARIERGETKGRLDTVLLIAAALGVAPIDLILPHEDEDQLIKIAGEIVVPAAHARDWIRGEAPLNPSSAPAHFAALPASKQEEILRSMIVAGAGSELAAAATGLLEPRALTALRLRLANDIDESLKSERKRRRKEDRDA